MVPYAGFAFLGFECWKRLMMRHLPGLTCYSSTKKGEATAKLVLTVPAKLLAGGLSGAMAQTLSYPLDVVGRRMHLAMMDKSTQKFGCVLDQIVPSNSNYLFLPAWACCRR